MTEQDQGSAEARLEAVRSELEQWRRTRPKLGRLPGHLWDRAASLGRTLGAYPVARALRLDYVVLKRRMVVPRANNRLARPPSQDRHPVVRDFIELTPSVAPSPSLASEAAVVEMVTADGARLTLRLKGVGPDVLALLAAFRTWR